MITRTSNHIKVEGHRGTWCVIAEAWFKLMPDINGKPVTILAHCFLLEHETYSDEAPCLIVGENGALPLDDVYNGFEDLEEIGWARAD